jgi:hypothetical protein
MACAGGQRRCAGGCLVDGHRAARVHDRRWDGPPFAISDAAGSGAGIDAQLNQGRRAVWKRCHRCPCKPAVPSGRSRRCGSVTGPSDHWTSSQLDQRCLRCGTRSMPAKLLWLSNAFWQAPCCAAALLQLAHSGREEVVAVLLGRLAVELHWVALRQVAVACCLNGAEVRPDIARHCRGGDDTPAVIVSPELDRSLYHQVTVRLRALERQAVTAAAAWRSSSRNSPRATARVRHRRTSRSLLPSAMRRLV